MIITIMIMIINPILDILNFHIVFCLLQTFEEHPSRRRHCQSRGSTSLEKSLSSEGPLAVSRPSSSAQVIADVIYVKGWIPLLQVSFQKLPYHTILFLKGTLNYTNHSEFIIY